MKMFALVFVLALVGCGTLDRPSGCRGPSFKLNEGQWDGAPMPGARPAMNAGSTDD